MINREVKHRYSGATGLITKSFHPEIKTSNGPISDPTKEIFYLIEWENGSNTWYSVKELEELTEFND